LKHFSSTALSHVLFFSNIKISHVNKVYLNIKMNLTSKVNIKFTFSVTLGLYSLYTDVEFLAILCHFQPDSAAKHTICDDLLFTAF